MKPLASRVVGTTALWAGFLWIIESFVVVNTTYTHADVYPRARVIGLVFGLLAFLCPGLAWRLLGRSGRGYIAFMAVANIAQLLLLLEFAIRAARS
ncbi:MAG: hypothetical protein ABFE13_08160 [Phycisphaerales bacterium]